jgi:hypothetical protein
MKRLLLLLLLMLTGDTVAQPFLRNSFTTNSPARVQGVLPTSTARLYPLSVNTNSSTADQMLCLNPHFWMQLTNAVFGGNLSAYSGTYSNALIMPFGTANTLLSISAAKFATSIPNNAGILTNDGAGAFGFTTNITQDVTINNFTTTNLTVINNLTVSNISVTNLNAQTINVTSNIYNVAKGGHLTVYSNLTVLQAGASKLLRTDANTNVAATTIGTGLTFDGTTLSRDALTGDVTTSANAATIANNAVTYAKMQDITAASRLLGRGSAAGSGDPQELDVGSGLQISGTTLSATSSGGGGTPGFTIGTGVGAFIQANYTNINNSATTATNNFIIVGGSDNALTNGIVLTNAVAFANAATPRGSALSVTNRFAILLLPGLYNVGDGALVLTKEYVDLIGISPNTGPRIYQTPISGDTKLLSTGDTLTINATGNDDIVLANLSLVNSNASKFALKLSTTGNRQKFLNLSIDNISDQGNPAVNEANWTGYYEDVRCFNANSFGYTATASGTFVRCKAAQNAFGTTASGTFLYCEADGSSFGNGLASGTFIQTRYINVVGDSGAHLRGFTSGFTGTAIGCVCPGTAPNYVSGTLRDCYFGTVRYNRGLTDNGDLLFVDDTYDIGKTGATRPRHGFFSGLVTAATGFSSSDTTAAVNIAASGWTNTFAKNAVVYYDGTAVTATVYNNAGTAVYTNATALSGGSIMLQPSGKVILSGTGVSGRAVPF